MKQLFFLFLIFASSKTFATNIFLQYKDVIKEVGFEHIVLETDSPYLTPEPFRGKQNNPGHVLEVAKFVANLYGISLEELAVQTNKNVTNMYKKMKLD